MNDFSKAQPYLTDVIIYQDISSNYNSVNVLNNFIWNTIFDFVLLSDVIYSVKI